MSWQWIIGDPSDEKKNTFSYTCAPTLNLFKCIFLDIVFSPQEKQESSRDGNENISIFLEKSTASHYV